MTNRWNKFGLILILVCISLLLSSAALADGVTLKNALTMTGSTEDKILLSDDFSKYEALTSDVYTHNQGKFVILYRINPEKEFSDSKTPFPEGFSGIDAGKPKVYLDVDRMKLIPEKYRAKSVEEIGNIIMLESFYSLSGVIYKNLNAFESEPNKADLMAIIRNEQNAEETTEVSVEQVEESYSYKPVFHGFTAITLYNAQNGTSVIFDARTFPYAELRANPEAADPASVIFSLGKVFNACLNKDPYAYSEAATEILLQEALEDSHMNQLQTLFEKNTIDYNAAQLQVTKLIWHYAEKVRKADKNNADLYDAVIEEESLEGLFYLLNECSYSAVNKSDAAIIRDKDYLGSIDLTTLDTMWPDAAEVMEIIEWDPELLYLLTE